MADRFDPYHMFRFRLKWEGRYVAGVSKVSRLSRITPVTSHQYGADPAKPRRLTGQSDQAAISLEGGVTHDSAFGQWASNVSDYHNGKVDEQTGEVKSQVVSLESFRKDIILEVFDEAGQMVIAYTIYRAWPSEFIAVPELDANAVTLAITSLKLENEGWERETASAQPASPNSC